ncbi:MAG: beta-aspartyl-peptidase [Candidatus Mcinerneyibacterium aminivorans]|uniref:Isoaspartyl dipeptidase n=1 Tax=Candidatus Mcinerneyibacterium aminivorans TaxID=2703815 RepID=A0A5D0MHI8_9BACT|nr:MAG: beta-aspartyl-peptidase [Candidatus Mcinerneyibacterium aminivorans]
MLLLKNANIYGPEYMGEKDILIENNIVSTISEKINISTNLSNLNIIDVDGDYVFPGFIDNHVHITGGGGEGGFSTRVPPIEISHIINSGITTVIGLLGTDGVSRSIEDLLAKAKALEEEGLTCFALTGSYGVPPVTLTGSLIKDIVFLDNIIGTGEIAIADHRSSQPTINQIKKIIAETRRAGMLSNKGGVVNFHIGKGKNGINMLNKIVEETEIPPSNILPTHVNRNNEIFNEAIEYAKSGGYIDLTAASADNKSRDKKSREVAGKIKKAIDNGVNPLNITISSDARGSLPRFDDNKELIELKAAKMDCLYEAFKKAVLEFEIPVNKALKPFTSNVSDIYKLKKKGQIKLENDADLLIADMDSLKIKKVIAKGVIVKDSNRVVKGVFEE